MLWSLVFKLNYFFVLSFSFVLSSTTLEWLKQGEVVASAGAFVIMIAVMMGGIMTWDQEEDWWWKEVVRLPRY